MRICDHSETFFTRGFRGMQGFAAKGCRPSNFTLNSLPVQGTMRVFLLQGAHMKNVLTRECDIRNWVLHIDTDQRGRTEES